MQRTRDLPGRLTLGLLVTSVLACGDGTMTVPHDDDGGGGGSDRGVADVGIAVDSRVGTDAQIDAVAAGDAGRDAGRDAAMDGGTGATPYDLAVLGDHPVAFWAMNRGATHAEPDLTGHGHGGTYRGGTPAPAAMPNGDMAADFDGSSQYVTIPSHASFSIPTTGNLTWEGWIRPDVLQFPMSSTDGYVDWMGKCEQYSPTCEWEARMYNTTNPQGRCNRWSAYVFNPSAGLGSGADWQPTCGLVQADHWYHVVGEYTLATQPASCTMAARYPGAINIWVNGVPWNQSVHGTTGCFSQYMVVPRANDSAITIGTMASDTWFRGAVGKVAVYDYLLSPTQIANHYRAMTGLSPSGSCGDTCTFR
jgi:hypothetical protein